MASLAYFTTPSLSAQTADKAYGITSDINKFNVSSSFVSAGTESVYAMLSGTILLQQQQTNANKVNLILRPYDQKELKLPVKYIIYRGLNILDFLDSVNVTDSTNKVKTSGSELLAAMQTIQTQRSPGVAIPVEALFGNELNPIGSKNIGDLFNKNLATSSQLFKIDCGIEIGKFAAGEVSIEIILENPELPVTVEIAKRTKYQIDVTSITDVAKKRWTQDLVRHFVDPAAFYGFHFDIKDGIEYRQGTNKLKADTSTLVYQNILSKFFTKNKIYLDIRNENGYSYNYYNNYKGTGVDANKNIKIGQTSTTLVSKEYNTNEWAIHIINVNPGTTSENEIFLSLRVSDNNRPLLGGHNIAITPNTVIDPPLSNTIARRVYFTDEIGLLNDPNQPQEFTNIISFKVPNVSVAAAQLATIVRMDYIKQLLPLSNSTIFKKQNLTDYLFGPLEVSIPWDLENKVQWFTSDHIAYVDALNDGYVVGKYKTTILSMDSASNEIEIFDEVPVDVSEAVLIENTAPNTLNVGKYTVTSIRNVNGKTFIKLKEPLPGAMQTGDKAVVNVKLDGSLDFEANKFIIKNKNYVNLEVLSANNRLNFYSRYGFSNSYEVSNVVYQNANTEIIFTASKAKVGFAGFAETGIVLETNTSTTSPNDDRVIYYASPLNYFSNNGIVKSSSFNAKGGAFNYESLLQGLEAIMPNVKIKKTKLSIGSDNILTFSYDISSKAKEALFLLGLTKTEWDTAKTSSATLSANHIKLFKLLGSGQNKTDKNKNIYYQYELIISGLDNNGAHQDVNTGITIYTLDHLIFNSKEFASKYDINVTIAEQNLLQFIDEILNGAGSELKNLNVSTEENIQLKKTLYWGNAAALNKLTKTNKELFNMAPSGTVITFKTIINGLKTSLDNVQVDKVAVENVLKTKGSELIKYAKEIIREKDASGVYKTYANLDGIVYLTRLICSVIIKNHPKLISKFPNNIQEFYDLFEKSSRGLNPSATSYPNFTKYFNPSNFSNELPAPSGSKKILITGFDPFGAGADERGYNSNPSGNIALALDGVKITNGSKNAIVRTALFPVRYREFNKGWVEEFATPFISSVDMVVTISYGTHYSKVNDHGFHLDRFAAKTRSHSTDNNNRPYNYDNDDYGYLQGIYGKAYLDKKDHPFIFNKLPIEKLLNSAGDEISVPNTNIVVNYGNTTLGPLTWKVFAKRKAHTTGSGTNIINVPVGPETDYTSLFANPPYTTGFPSYFANINKSSSGDEIEMKFESNKKKYFAPKPSVTTNSDYIPNITWNDFKDPGMEVDYEDFRIKAENGSGGGYLSNEIHYRVAYLRETIKDTLPNGHIHIGFLSDDQYQSREDMIKDINHILEKFLEAL